MESSSQNHAIFETILTIQGATTIRSSLYYVASYVVEGRNVLLSHLVIILSFICAQNYDMGFLNTREMWGMRISYVNAQCATMGPPQYCIIAFVRNVMAENELNIE